MVHAYSVTLAHRKFSDNDLFQQCIVFLSLRTLSLWSVNAILNMSLTLLPYIHTQHIHTSTYTAHTHTLLPYIHRAHTQHIHTLLPYIHTQHIHSTYTAHTHTLLPYIHSTYTQAHDSVIKQIYEKHTVFLSVGCHCPQVSPVTWPFVFF